MALVSWLPLIPLPTFDLSVPLTLRPTCLISSFLLLVICFFIKRCFFHLLLFYLDYDGFFFSFSGFILFVFFRDVQVGLI